MWLVIPLMMGLALGQMREFLPVRWLLFGAACLSVLALIATWRSWRWFWWAPALGLSMILVGAASYAMNRPRLKDWDSLPPRQVRVALRVDRVFAQTDPRKCSGLATVVRADSPVEDLGGQRIYYSLASMRGKAAPVRGAVVRAVGVTVTLPLDPPANTFDGFLAGAGINFRLTRGRIVAEEQPAPPYRRFCARTLEKFSAMLGSGVLAKRPALVGILRAMLLGQQNELTPQQNTLFRQSGTMHVFSISGLHIAVIWIGLQAVLSLLRLPRWIVLVLGLTTLWLYVDITGTAPSAVRAFAMVAFVEVALALRVARNPLSALTASALLILLATPLDIFSASFQMSYGIVAALLLLGLPLADRCQAAIELFRDLPRVSWAWHHHWRDLAWRTSISALGIGVASSLVSAVTGAQFFQLFTPGALLANLWVIPVSSLVILLGLVSLLSGLAGFTTLMELANHAAVLVLWIVDFLLRVNLELPGMWIGASFRLPGLGAFALVALLASMLAGYMCHWRGWCRGFWPPFAVVALAMIFGVKFG